MTNWMTAAGLALIAGGLATLICFRSVLFGRGSRPAEPADIQPQPRRATGNRRRSRAPEPLIPPAEEDPRGPLAELGLADEDEDLFPYGKKQRADEDEDLFPYGEKQRADEGEDLFPYGEKRRTDEPEFADLADDRGEYVPDREMPVRYREEPGEYREVPGEYAPEPAELVGLELVPDLPPDPEPAFDDFEDRDRDDRDDDREPAYPTGDRYGHRVEGWVRPEYRPVRAAPPSGEYWTPIPVDLDPDPEPSAKGYGWPAPVERLPAVPDYEPATGFDLAPVEHEPTEMLASRRGEQVVRLPRTWSDRNDKRERREWRTENEALPTTQLFASDDAPPARRRRPRPRPRPSAESSDRSTRVYVSRHAAEPPPR